MKSRSIRTLAPALILVGATLAAPAASASAPTKQRVFAPARSDAGALVFHLRGVTPRSVRRGYLEPPRPPSPAAHRDAPRRSPPRPAEGPGSRRRRSPLAPEDRVRGRHPHPARRGCEGRPAQARRLHLLRSGPRTRRIRRGRLARRLLAALRGRLALQLTPLPQPAPRPQVRRHRAAPDRLGLARRAAGRDLRHRIRLAAPHLLLPPAATRCSPSTAPRAGATARSRACRSGSRTRPARRAATTPT